MKKTFTFLFVLFLSIVIIGSCTKDKEQYVATSKSELIKEAKKSYDDELLKQGSLPLSSDYNVKQAVSKTILWEKAQTKKISLGDAVIVPIQFEKELFIKQGKEGELVSLDKLIHLMIYKDKKGESQQELVTTIPYTQVKSNNGNFVGLVIIEDLQGKFKKGYAYNEKGEIRKVYLDRTQIFRKINNFRTLFCQEIEMWGYNYWPDGQSSPYLIETQIYCINYNSTEEEDGPGGNNENNDGSSGSTGGPDYNPPQREINNNLTDPCLRATITNALATNKDVKGFLSDLITNYAGLNNGIIINISNGNIPRPAQTTPSFTSNTFIADIVFQNGYYNDVSKETVVAALIHEVVHAYLLQTSSTYRNQPKEEQHNFLYTNFVHDIATYLINKYNMPSDNAYGLAWSGMGELYIAAGPNDTFKTTPAIPATGTTPAIPAKTMTKTQIGGAVAPYNFVGTGSMGTPNCP